MEYQEQDLETLLADTRDRHEVVGILHGSRCHTKQEFFDEVSAVLRFPDYFGRNWDAFSECMNDLEDWLPATNYLLVITNAEQFLLSEPPKERAVCMDILARAAERWRSGANHARFVHATGEAGGIGKVGFAVVLQLRPGLGLTQNLGSWPEAVNIPMVRE